MAKGSFEAFKTQLVNSILSCPIICIILYHFSYVDEVLKDIFEYKTLSLYAENIIEYNNGQGCIINFSDKKEQEAGKV